MTIFDWYTSFIRLCGISIATFFFCCVAMGESLTAHIDGDENPADLLTKVICGGKRRYIVNNILHDVYDGEFKPYAVTE